MSVSINKIIYSKKYDKTSYFLYFLLICIPFLFFGTKTMVLVVLLLFEPFSLFKDGGELSDVLPLKYLPIDECILAMLPIIIAIIVLSGYFAITCNNEMNKKNLVLPKISELLSVIIQGLKLFIPVTICFIPFFISILLSIIGACGLFFFALLGAFNGFQGAKHGAVEYSLGLFLNSICIFSLIGIITAFLILPLILNYCKSLSFLNIRYKIINSKLFLLTIMPLVANIFICLPGILLIKPLGSIIIMILPAVAGVSCIWYIYLYLIFPNLCNQIYSNRI